MKIRNRLQGAAILLIAAMILSVSAVAGGTDDVRLKPSESGDRATEIVSALGIYRDDAEDKNAISRVEYAVMIARVLGVSSSEAPGEDPYQDFFKYEYASGDLAYLKENGIMIGDEENRFHPNDPIDPQSALVVGVRALGYRYRLSDDASAIDAIRVARETGLDQGIDTSSRTMDEAVLKKVLYHILCANYMEWEERAGKPLLTAVWGLEKVEGVVTSNDVTGIYHADDQCRKDEIMIGEQRYKDLSGNGRNCLGRNVTAFVDRGTDELRYLYETNNRSLFSDDRTFYYDHFRLSYQNDNGKTVSYTLSPQFAFIYNGKSILFDASYFDGDEKQVTLIDNDSDGIYDVVTIEHYTYDVIDQVNLRLNTFVCRYSGQSVQAESDDNVIVELYVQDALTDTMDSVSEESLIQYYCSDDYINVY